MNWPGNRRVQAGAAAAMICLCVVAGCVSGEASVASGPPKTVRLDLDPARAYLALSAVPPPVARPAATEVLPLPERAVQPIAASKSLIAEQRFTEAALELERAFRFAPNHPQIHLALAMLHWQAGNLERAKSHALQTIEKMPDSSAAHYILGRCLATAGDLAGAMIEWRTALLCRDFGEDGETAALCHFHLAEALAAEGYLTAALEQYEAFGRRSTISPMAKGELASLLTTRRGSTAEGKSRALERLGRYEEAARALGPVAAAPEANVDVRVRYARLLLNAGRLREAEEAVQSIQSDEEEVLSLVLEVFERAGRLDRAVEDLRSRATSRPSALTTLWLADVLVRLGRTDEVGAELSGFLERDPGAEAIRRRFVETLVADSRWVEALRSCAAGMRLQPTSQSDWEAVAVGMSGDPRAVNAIIASAAEESSDAHYLYLCGSVAQAGVRPEVAKALFRRAMEIDPRLAPARVALANMLLHSCDLEGALRWAKRTDPDVPEDARLERVLARIHDRLDDWSKAEVYFRAAMQLDRADTESMFELASLYRRTGRPLQAQRQLRVLLDVDAGHERARELIALTLIEEGKNDAAVQEYRQLLSTSKKPGTIARCKALLDNDLRRDGEARRKLFLDALNEDGRDAPLLIAIAETYEDSDPAKAREYFAKAVDVEPNDEEAALGVVRSDQHLLEFERAAAGIEDLLRCRPNRHVWRRAMYGFYGLLNQYDRAISDARGQELRDDLTDEQREAYRDSIVEMLREAGRGDEGIQSLKDWSDADPNNADWKRKLAIEYLRQRRFPEAVERFVALYLEEPDQGMYRDRLLESLRGAGRHERAAQYILDWMQDDAQDDRLLAVLAHTLGDDGRMDEAVELLVARLPRSPNREMLQDVLTNELSAEGRHDECSEWLEGMADELLFVMRASRDRLDDTNLNDDRRARRPNEPYSADRLHERFETVRLRRVVALTNARRFRDAGELLDAALSASPDPRLRLRLLYLKSTVLRAEGLHDAADEAMKTALQVQPGDESISNDLAYNWIDRGVHLDEARPMIRHALGRMPRQPAYLDTYGWLLYKVGDFAGAELWLSRSNRIRGGDDPVIHDHLGDVYWRLDRGKIALEHWGRAVELIREKRDGELNSDDERRVRDGTPQKIERATKGEEPAVAETADRGTP